MNNGFNAFKKYIAINIVCFRIYLSCFEHIIISCLKKRKKLFFYISQMFFFNSKKKRVFKSTKNLVTFGSTQPIILYLFMGLIYVPSGN